METNAQFDALLLLAGAVGLPLTLGLAGVALAAGVRQRARGPAVAAAVLLAFLGGYVTVNYQQWRLLPQQATDWLPVLAVAASAVLLMLEWRGARPRAWLAAQALLALAAAWLMLPPMLKDQGLAGVVVDTVGWAALCLCCWRVLDGCATGARAPVLALGSGALGLVVALGGSVVIGCSALSLMGAVAGAWLYGRARAAAPLPGALVGCGALLYAAIAMAAYFYAEISPWLLAGVTAWLLPVRLMRRALLIAKIAKT
jgi:hypothetical protein